MMHMVERRSLYVYDISNFAVGPTYTFASTRGMSYIDHCLVSASLVDSILRCEIEEEHILNTSDHLPIKVDVHVSGMTPVVTNTGILKERVAWERLRAGWVGLSGGFTPCRHLRPSSGREHTIVTQGRWYKLTVHYPTRDSPNFP